MEQFSGYSGELREYNRMNLRLSTAFRSREADPNTNCEIYFNITTGAMSSVKKVDISGVSIPNNFNNISSYCNRFVLEVYTPPAAPVDYLITIPPNYYTATELAAVIETAIKVYVPSATFIFNTALKKFQFNTNTLATAISFNVDNTQATTNLSYNNFMYLIGAKYGTPLDNILFTFPSPPNLVGASAVYILSDKLGMGKGTRSTIQSETLTKSISSVSSTEILSVFLDNPFGTYYSYYNNGSQRGQLAFQSSLTMDKIDLRFTDVMGNILEQNSDNMPISLSLTLYY